MKRIVLLLGAGLSVVSAHALAVEVRGSRSCEKWAQEMSLAGSSKELNRVPALITKSWFLGYLSGRDAGKDFLNGTDNDSIFLWLDNYCRAHPKASLDRAGNDLARELMQMKNIRP